MNSDTERLDWMIAQCGQVVNPLCSGAYWVVYFAANDREAEFQTSAYTTARDAIDAGMRGEGDPS